MRDARPVGVYKDTAFLPDPYDKGTALEYGGFAHMGVHVDVFRRFQQLGLASAIAQYYGLVQQGMLFADIAHLFKGLRRPMALDGNMKADEDVLVYSWRPEWDYEWDWKDQKPIRRTPPPERVFVLQVKPFATPDADGLIGTVLHWNWVDEDPMLESAPINPQARYTEKLWTKPRFKK